MDILGPAECPIARIAGNARVQILLRSGEAAGPRAVLAAVLETYSTPANVYLELDVDPVSLL